jgi:molecular chaperone HtpG
MPPMPDKVIIGVNILETLTTGMYRDAKVIYREYIQNACDQIDEAVLLGLYERQDGNIEIFTDADSISIEDNATGIPAEDFKETLYCIGESKKTAGQNRGFRGIGHWCGFAHCETLVFIAKAVGERIESIMTCDAAQMRSMMLKHRLKVAEYSIDDVLSSTTEFSTNEVSNIESHYFKVVMKGITDAKDEICNHQYVKDYLSFIIPVSYATEFRFKKQIHEYANDIGQGITEYNVRINGEPVRKQYKPTFTTHGKGDDEIKGVQFKAFNDDNGNLVAWMWFGVSSFKAQMIPANKMRGIRLRSMNIQVGDESALQRLFNESNGRGLYYYIGEVFAVSSDLLPDSQRDYFESGEARTQFERLLYSFFNDELKSIYYAGSKVNSAFDKIDKAEQLESEISQAIALGKSVTEEQQAKLERAKKEAESATNELEKIRKKNAEQRGAHVGTVEAVVSEIIKTNEEKRAKRPIQTAKPVSPMTVATAATATINPIEKEENKAKKPTEKLIPISKVREIISILLDSSTADAIVALIEEELQ